MELPCQGERPKRRFKEKKLLLFCYKNLTNKITICQMEGLSRGTATGCNANVDEHDMVYVVWDNLQFKCKLQTERTYV